jgi:ABC-type multidrug transport system ATPase subunit
MVAPRLEVSGLAVELGGRRVLDAVDFTLAAGRILAVIGPNGAGKTTLLEALCGLLPNASGSVRVDGGPARHFADRARAFAFAPEGARLASELLVSDVLAHADAHGGTSALHSELRAALGVGTLAPRPAGALSRGERQRVVLYTALSAARPIVVLDEPFEAFDPLQVAEVLTAVRAAAARGASVVCSLHQLTHAEKIADDVLLLADGRVVAWGDLDVVRRRGGAPASLEQAFIALLSEGR